MELYSLVMLGMANDSRHGIVPISTSVVPASFSAWLISSKSYKKKKPIPVESIVANKN